MLKGTPHFYLDTVLISLVGFGDYLLLHTNTFKS